MTLTLTLTLTLTRRRRSDPNPNPEADPNPDPNPHLAQVTLLKQEKVAALADSDARLALKNPFEVATLSSNPNPNLLL